MNPLYFCVFDWSIMKRFLVVFLIVLSNFFSRSKIKIYVKPKQTTFKLFELLQLFKLFELLLEV